MLGLRVANDAVQCTMGRLFYVDVENRFVIPPL